MRKNSANNNACNSKDYAYNTTPLDVSYEWTSLATEIKEEEEYEIAVLKT